MGCGIAACGSDSLCEELHKISTERNEELLPAAAIP